MSTYTAEDKRKVTTHRLVEMKQRGEKISMLTAYDYSMAKLIDDKIELEKKIELYENQINYLKYDILNYINYLTDNNSAEVLKLKYIESLTTKEIARRLNYSERWVFKKQKDGIAELKEILSSM